MIANFGSFGPYLKILEKNGNNAHDDGQIIREMFMRVNCSVEAQSLNNLIEQKMGCFSGSFASLKSLLLAYDSISDCEEFDIDNMNKIFNEANERLDGILVQDVDINILFIFIRIGLLNKLGICKFILLLIDSIELQSQMESNDVKEIVFNNVHVLQSLYEDDLYEDKCDQLDEVIAKIK